jgi:hypothetical protein
MILTPLPGSEMHGKLLNEGRIVDEAWDTYDAHHVKFQPLHLTPWELQWSQIEAHTRFYSPLQVIKRLVRGRIGGFIIGVYANILNKRWQRQERSYLALLQNTKAAFRARVSGGTATTA